jgi:hypothetical protein
VMVTWGLGSGTLAPRSPVMHTWSVPGIIVDRARGTVALSGLPGAPVPRGWSATVDLPADP